MRGDVAAEGFWPERVVFLEGRVSIIVIAMAVTLAIVPIRRYVFAAAYRRRAFEVWGRR